MTTAPSSPADSSHTATAPLARLVELALVVPLEVSGRLVEALPVVVDKVPSAAARVRREIVLARFLGKLVVDQGISEVRSRLAPDPVPADAPTATPTTHALSASTPRTEGSAPAPPTVAVDAATLALADYDHLSSAQVVSKLDGLDADERAAIEAYEQAGRHRRTILGKLEQLRTAEVGT